MGLGAFRVAIRSRESRVLLIKLVNTVAVFEFGVESGHMDVALCDISWFVPVVESGPAETIHLLCVKAQH